MDDLKITIPRNEYCELVKAATQVEQIKFAIMNTKYSGDLLDAAIIILGIEKALKDD